MEATAYLLKQVAEIVSNRKTVCNRLTISLKDNEVISPELKTKHAATVNKVRDARAMIEKVIYQHKQAVFARRNKRANDLGMVNTSTETSSLPTRREITT
ncbi:hypothetical protein KM043_017588 [Ampulex compressa]|nr:hypothetical protein KM043_017588 [Ampulex compressa]